MLWDKKYALILAVIVSSIPHLFNKSSEAKDYIPNHDPAGYIIEKFQSHEILFIGTRHKRQPILKLLSDLIFRLHDAGISYIGLVIGSDQQNEIDHYLETGIGLGSIVIHPQIDCFAYSNILKRIWMLDKVKRPGVIAIDLPKSGYGGKMGRDRSMAESIARVLQDAPGSKMLVITGNNHILKRLNWQDHVPNKTGSIRSYLDASAPKISAFSIGQIIDADPKEWDFTRCLGHRKKPVAIDCDDSYHGWKIGLTYALAIKPTEPCDLIDGLIVY